MPTAMEYACVAVSGDRLASSILEEAQELSALLNDQSARGYSLQGTVYPEPYTGTIYVFSRPREEEDPGDLEQLRDRLRLITNQLAPLAAAAAAGRDEHSQMPDAPNPPPANVITNPDDDLAPPELQEQAPPPFGFPPFSREPAASIQASLDKTEWRNPPKPDTPQAEEPLPFEDRPSAPARSRALHIRHLGDLPAGATVEVAPMPDGRHFQIKRLRLPPGCLDDYDRVEIANQPFTITNPDDLTATDTPAPTKGATFKVRDRLPEPIVGGVRWDKGTTGT